MCEVFLLWGVFPRLDFWVPVVGNCWTENKTILKKLNGVVLCVMGEFNGANVIYEKN